MPRWSTRRLPSISRVARSFSTDTTKMPRQVWPTLMVLGSPPSTATTAALSPMTPISATSAAAAGPPASSSKSAIIRRPNSVNRGMKPVAIVRVARSEGPGYFDTYLQRRSIAATLIALDAGEPVPRDPRRYAGLAFLGGPMSVNDDLPWIAPALELIRNAVRKDVPVLGHCLGGQLM